MGIFDAKCAHCGATEHATSDCPHSLFTSTCAHCGAVEHATSQCPHSLFETECSHCGNKGHAIADCPHGLFQTECAHCGGTGHAVGDCPHNLFSDECSRCGSKEHAIAKCPQGLFSSRPSQPRYVASSDEDDSSWSGFFAKITAGLLLIGCAIWFAVFVVIPLAVMNSAAVLAILASWKKTQRTLFASLSLVGAGYLLVDVSAGWLSAMFSTAMENSAVVTGIVVLNSVAAAVSTWFLVEPLWAQGQALKETDQNAGRARMAGAGSLVALSLIAIPISYKFIAKDFAIPQRVTAGSTSTSNGATHGSADSGARPAATSTCASGGSGQFIGGNLRSDPRHSADAQNIIAIVDPGASVTILDVTQGEARRTTGNTQWLRVKVESGTCSFDKRSSSAGYSCVVGNLPEGYVNADLVAGCGNPAPSQSAPTNASGTGSLLTNVNLRSCPDKTCSSLGEHFKNASFEIEELVEKDGINWYKIRITQPGCHALNPSWCGKKLLRSKHLPEVNRDHYLEGDNTATDTGWINSYNRDLNVYTVRLD